MGKIVLVFPKMDGPESTSPSLSTSEHLGLASLATSLRNIGHIVLIINAEVEKLDTSDIVNRIIKFEPILLGCSPVSLSIDNSLDLISKVKAANRKILTVFGGHLASLCASDMISNEPNIDFILKGDAEFTILELLNRIINKIDFHSVPGIVFKNENGNVYENQHFNGYIDLDDIPICERDDLKYLSQKKSFDNSARILASRGCNYNCSFCTTPSFYGKVVRFRNENLVIEEMNLLYKKYGINHFWFNDDLFVNNTPSNYIWIRSFTKLLKKNKVKYSYRILCRADSFNKNNIKLLDDLIDSGLTHIYFGLESGTQNSLDVFNKKTTVSQNRFAIELIKEKNIELQIGFIMFNPYSQFEDILESTKFLFEIDELYRIFPITRSLSVFPGTAIAKKLQDDGLLISKSYREPLTCYMYKDDRIAYLADLMYNAYKKHFQIDNDINKIIKGIHKNNKANYIRKELGDCNFDRFNSLTQLIRKRKFMNKVADLEYINSWMNDLEQIINI